MKNNYCPRCGKSTVGTAGQCTDWDCGTYTNSKPKEIDENKLAKLLFDMQSTRALSFHQLSSYYSNRWRKRAHEIATSDIWKKEEKR